MTDALTQTIAQADQMVKGLGISFEEAVRQIGRTRGWVMYEESVAWVLAEKAGASYPSAEQATAEYEARMAAREAARA